MGCPPKAKPLEPSPPRVGVKEARPARWDSRAVEHEQSDDHHQDGDETTERHDAAQVDLGHFVPGLECNALIHGQPFMLFKHWGVSLAEHFQM